MPNRISIGSAVFAGFIPVMYAHIHRQTDRQTDHATMSVAIDYIYMLCIYSAS